MRVTTLSQHVGQEMTLQRMTLKKKKIKFWLEIKMLQLRNFQYNMDLDLH